MPALVTQKPSTDFSKPTEDVKPVEHRANNHGCGKRKVPENRENTHLGRKVSKPVEVPVSSKSGKTETAQNIPEKETPSISLSPGRHDETISDEFVKKILESDDGKYDTPVVERVAVKRNKMRVEIPKVYKLQMLAQKTEDSNLKSIRTLLYELEVRRSEDHQARMIKILATARIFLNGYDDQENKCLSVFVGAKQAGETSGKESIPLAITLFIPRTRKGETLKKTIRMNVGEKLTWRGLKQFVSLDELSNFVSEEEKMILGVKLSHLENH